MDFCDQEGLDPSKSESQLIYLDWELRNQEKRAFRELMKTDTPYDSLTFSRNTMKDLVKLTLNECQRPRKYTTNCHEGLNK